MEKPVVTTPMPSPSGRLDPHEVALMSVQLAAIPALTMLIGGLYPMLTSSPPSMLLTYALQHLAAGILLCAIAQELVPTLSDAKTQDELVAMTVGFGTGVAAMVILAHVLGGDDEDDKSADGDDDDDEEGHRLPLLSGGENDGEDVGGLARQSSGNDTPLKRSYAGQAAEYIQEKASRNEQTKFPWPFAIAVYIDAAMDGLLIGLTLITSESAGLFMAVALCVEMGFLGLTFSTSTTSLPFYKKVFANALGPCILVLSALVGGLTVNFFAANQSAVVGFTGFGTAALLYMVCEELLVSAHESGDNHVWWIDLQVYLGFMFSLVLNKAFMMDGGLVQTLGLARRM